MRATIKTIAKDLGISHMTVSRALSGNPNVQKDTRDMVIKRAQELGYVRSAAARAMRGDAPQIIGLLLPNIENEFYARFANTLARDLERCGFQVIIHLTDDDEAIESQALARLCEIQAQVTMYVPAPRTRENREPPRHDMQTIQLIRERVPRAQSPLIGLDDTPALRQAVIHLAKTGRRTIGYIGADTTLSSGRSRHTAFMQGVQDAGLAADDCPVITGPPSFEMARAATRELIREKNADAIVCGGFEISNGTLDALLEETGSVSGDVMMIGYGDPSYAKWIGGGISTIRIPVEAMAHRAAEMLMKTSENAPVMSISFETELVLR